VSIRPYWTSEARDERSYAAILCQRCPVQPECATWSLALPITDTAVYAGLSAAERLRAKRAARDELAKQALAGYRRMLARRIPAFRPARRTLAA
jgi:hypothetical protein